MGTGIFLGRRRIGGETLPIGQTWTLYTGSYSSGTWVVPYTTNYNVCLIGGGGGGGPGGYGTIAYRHGSGGGGGGGGSSMLNYICMLTKGDSYSYSIGRGGYGRDDHYTDASATKSSSYGKPTSFGSYSVDGGISGERGADSNNDSGGAGGAGGAGVGLGSAGSTGSAGVRKVYQNIASGGSGGAGGANSIYVWDSAGNITRKSVTYGKGGTGGTGAEGYYSGSGDSTNTSFGSGYDGTAGAIIITLVGGQDDYKTVSYSRHDASAPTGIYEFSEFGTGTSSTSPPSSNPFYVKAGGKIAFGWPSGYSSSTTTITENGTTIATLSNGSSLDYTVTQNLSIYTKYDYTDSTIAITTT